MKNVIYQNDDTIIGCPKDIISDIKHAIIVGVNNNDITQANTAFEMLEDLTNEFARFEDNELVICRYNPMGAWFATRMIEDD